MVEGEKMGGWLGGISKLSAVTNLASSHQMNDYLLLKKLNIASVSKNQD